MRERRGCRFDCGAASLQNEKEKPRKGDGGDRDGEPASTLEKEGEVPARNDTRGKMSSKREEGRH